MVPRGGIEPPTRGFSVRKDSNQNACNTNTLGVDAGSVRTHSAQNEDLDVVLKAIERLPDDARKMLFDALKPDE